MLFLKKLIIILIVVATFFTGIAFAGVKVNSDTLYQSGIEAFQEMKFVKATQLLRKAIEKGISQDKTKKAKRIIRECKSFFLATIDIIRSSDESVTSHVIKAGEEIPLPDNQGILILESFSPHLNFRGCDLGEALVGKIVKKDASNLPIALPLRFPTFDRMRRGKFIFVVKKLD